MIACACRTGENITSLTFSEIFDRITHDCAVDLERKKKEVKDDLVDNEINKSIIFRLFEKSNSTKNNHHSNTLGLLNHLSTRHTTERKE